MKRTALKRKTPLRRKRPMRRKAKAQASTYRRRPRDIPYMLKVKKLACFVSQWHPGWFNGMGISSTTTCEGRVEADHAGGRALGKKADDATCIPLCRRHHRERTERAGTFSGWSAPDMRIWCDWAIQVTQREVEEMTHG